VFVQEVRCAGVGGAERASAVSGNPCVVRQVAQAAGTMPAGKAMCALCYCVAAVSGSGGVRW